MAINRANQTWPEEMVHDMCLAEGFDSTDESKIQNLVAKIWDGTVTPLAPYAHELNGQGTACAADCPACTWIDVQRGCEPWDEMERRTR